jgi:uncharacterized protein (TIGR02246 family)
MSRQNERHLDIKEVPMQRHFLSRFRAASLAALPAVLLLIVSAACNDESDATGPLGGRHIQATQAALGAIPTAPILDIVSALTTAWAAKDAAAYAAPYADDLQFINPLGAVISGQDAFRAQHVFLFNGPFAGSTLTLVVRDIQFLTGTIAIVYLDGSLTGYAFLPPGLPSSGGVQRTRSTWVVEKRGGEWQIVFQQYTPQL